MSDSQVMKAMELSDLAVFTQVVDCGGITRAAEKLNRVPSNVTARIQKLEDELGKPLFLRDRNRLRISAAGEQFLGRAREILELARYAVEEFQDTRPTGVLAVGAMEAVAATRLVAPMVQFHRDYPNVELNVTTAPTGDLIEKVLDGDVDLAFVADPPPDPRLDCQPVFREELVMVSSLGHRSIRKPQDLGPSPTMLGFGHRCAYRTRLSDWLRQGDSQAKILEINSYHTLLSCVAAGMGVGIVPRALLEHYPFRDDLRAHPLPAKWRKSTTAIIWRQDNLKASMEAFINSVV
jgi:DNA-binding transcriptional LysR family regulator